MIYSTDLHPGEQKLAAYLQQPALVEYDDISTHLAQCAECRKQINMMTLLKGSVTDIAPQNFDDQQQKLVDDYVYDQLDEQKAEEAKLQIKQNPQLLKSALHGLAQQAGNHELQAQTKQQIQEVPQTAGFKLTEWIQGITASWVSIPVTAVASVMLTLMTFQLVGVISEQNNAVTIASYQDSENIRFLSQNRMPGIGFFSTARQQSEPYQNIQISLKPNQLLELKWQAVNNAQDYNLKISRFNDGNKTVREKITTMQTQATLSLTEADYNQRFEWTLSGDTTDGKTFITSGGFVMNRNKD